jgi:glycosyltransferase involved in cell wall biosynthesis
VIKLVIQIPCHNEEKTIGLTLSSLPRQIPGVDVVERLIVDDGSTDRTVEEAVAAGVEHVIRFPAKRGLAKAFMAGIEASIKAGADIIVNTDGDNQYRADALPRLVEPILSGKADMVVGVRSVSEIEHFSPLKKALHRLGSWVVGVASRTDIPDAPSGFRAFSREAAMRLNVFSEYTYTLETIIQAGLKGMALVTVPVETNDPTRPSRLIRSMPGYVLRSIATILRIFVTYRPLRFFAFLGAVAFVPGFLISLRFLFFYLSGHGGGHVQSLILSALLMGTGFFLFVVALVVDLIAVNRQFLERVDWRLKKVEETLGRKGPDAR